MGFFKRKKKSIREELRKEFVSRLGKCESQEEVLEVFQWYANELKVRLNEDWTIMVLKKKEKPWYIN